MDATADLDMALAITENAKCQRPGVCNAMETLLVHKDIAPRFLPKIGEILHIKNVAIVGDKICCEQIHAAKPAEESDWHTEYLDMIIAIIFLNMLACIMNIINNFDSNNHI